MQRYIALWACKERIENGREDGEMLGRTFLISFAVARAAIHMGDVPARERYRPPPLGGEFKEGTTEMKHLLLSAQIHKECKDQRGRSSMSESSVVSISSSRKQVSFELRSPRSIARIALLSLFLFPLLSFHLAGCRNVIWS
jgi:hypothetical protein